MTPKNYVFDKDAWFLNSIYVVFLPFACLSIHKIDVSKQKLLGIPRLFVPARLKSWTFIGVETGYPGVGGTAPLKNFTCHKSCPPPTKRLDHFFKGHLISSSKDPNYMMGWYAWEMHGYAAKVDQHKRKKILHFAESCLYFCYWENRSEFTDSS